ncbi:hypothetical protein EVJ58_g8275 [Rhodofomes roseus]|uniref:Uncharacterized protein n=1 Tax=Rhodofomes roseus TaxID=34475 RepID=A0A4Y9Y0F1_9APHY|nr:hypothetical protein EVJ58_g8275 [Rhodofomes roseus]
MEAPKPAMTTATQPQAVQMTREPEPGVPEPQGEPLRGGGAGKDCFIGAFECFICFEGCKDCCECCADIICCPCEMCC